MKKPIVSEEFLSIIWSISIISILYFCFWYTIYNHELPTDYYIISQLNFIDKCKYINWEMFFYWYKNYSCFYNWKFIERYDELEKELFILKHKN